MIVKSVVYDEDSIKVQIDDPTVTYDPVTSEPKNVMNIQVTWSPETKYTDEFIQRLAVMPQVADESWSDLIKRLVIGATVQAIVKKFDEGVTTSR